MTSSTTTGQQTTEGRSVRDIVEHDPDQVNEAWCRKIYRKLLQSLELQYAMQMPHRAITADTVVFHDNGEPLLLPSIVSDPNPEQAGDLTALARLIHYAITQELIPTAPLHGRGLEGYSDSLISAVDRCMDPDPERRPQTIDELRDILGVVALGTRPRAAAFPPPFADDELDEQEVLPVELAEPAQTVQPAQPTPLVEPTPLMEPTPLVEPTPLPEPTQAAQPAEPKPLLEPTQAAQPTEPTPLATPTQAVPPQPPAAPTQPVPPAKPTPLPEPAQSMQPPMPMPPMPTAQPPAPPPAAAQQTLPPHPAASIIPPAPASALASGAAPVAKPVAEPAAKSTAPVQNDAAPAARPGLSRRQRQAVAAGGAAILLAIVLAVYAEMRDAGSFGDPVLTLPPPAAGQPQGDGAVPAAAPAGTADTAPQAASATQAPYPATQEAAGAAMPTDPNAPPPSAGAGLPGAPLPVPGNPAATPMPPVKGSASYNLQIQPWGVVYVDGVDRGVSPPIKRLVLAPGRHTVRVTNPNFTERTLEVDTTMGDGRIAVDFSESSE